MVSTVEPRTMIYANSSLDKARDDTGDWVFFRARICEAPHH